MTDIEQHDDVQVFVVVDLGKGAHHAFALDRKGKRLLDSALPNDEAKLRALLGRLKAHGPVLLVVDQPATVGALPVAVARDQGVLVAYLPDLAMRRIADLHAGESKTDARDAYIIAEAARSPGWRKTSASFAVCDLVWAACSGTPPFPLGSDAAVTSTYGR